jgi:hypothetical protein
VQEALGGRLRWVEVGSAVPDDTARALVAAGIHVDVGDVASGFVN